MTLEIRPKSDQSRLMKGQAHWAESDLRYKRRAEGIYSSRFFGNKKFRNNILDRVITKGRNPEHRVYQDRDFTVHQSSSDSANFTDRSTRFWKSGFSLCTIKVPANAHSVLKLVYIHN